MRLLVSVVDAAEARVAAAAGADVIDVKDPSLGALGEAAPHVVRATEGYTAGLPGLRLLLLPLTSSMIVTEPLSDDVWAEIGWERQDPQMWTPDVPRAEAEHVRLRCFRQRFENEV